MHSSTSNFAVKIQQPKKQPRKYLAPQLGSSNYEERSQAMEAFLPEFKTFLHVAGITERSEVASGLL